MDGGSYEYIFQCQVCGHLHKVKMKREYNIEDDLFVKMKCPKCRDRTQHIWCGENKEDVYLYGNNNLDQRFFNYKTK